MALVNFPLVFVTLSVTGPQVLAQFHSVTHSQQRGKEWSGTDKTQAWWIFHFSFTMLPFRSKSLHVHFCLCRQHPAISEWLTIKPMETLHFLTAKKYNQKRGTTVSFFAHRSDGLEDSVKSVWCKCLHLLLEFIEMNDKWPKEKNLRKKKATKICKMSTRRNRREQTDAKQQWNDAKSYKIHHKHCSGHVVCLLARWITLLISPSTTWRPHRIKRTTLALPEKSFSFWGSALQQAKRNINIEMNKSMHTEYHLPLSTLQNNQRGTIWSFQQQ